VPGFSDKEALGVIEADALAGRKYKAGNAARVEVIGIREARGRTIVNLKPAPKPPKK
jgi:hypothetical protein